MNDALALVEHVDALVLGEAGGERREKAKRALKTVFTKATQKIRSFRQRGSAKIKSTAKNVRKKLGGKAKDTGGEKAKERTRSQEGSKKSKSKSKSIPGRMKDNSGKEPRAGVAAGLSAKAVATAKADAMAGTSGSKFRSSFKHHSRLGETGTHRMKAARQGNPSAPKGTRSVNQTRHWSCSGKGLPQYHQYCWNSQKKSGRIQKRDKAYVTTQNKARKQWEKVANKVAKYVGKKDKKYDRHGAKDREDR